MNNQDSPYLVGDQIEQYLGGIGRTTRWKLIRKGLPKRRIQDCNVEFYIKEEVDKWMLENSELINTNTNDGSELSPEEQEAIANKLFNGRKRYVLKSKNENKNEI